MKDWKNWDLTPETQTCGCGHGGGNKDVATGFADDEFEYLKSQLVSLNKEQAAELLRYLKQKWRIIE